MSIEVMTLVFKRYPEGGNERLLALAIADQARADGTHIFPSVATLAQMSMQSERSVQRLMGVMLASGWLQLVRRTTGRRGQANEYRISPEWIAGGAAIPPPAVPDRRAASKTSTGDKLAPVKPVDNLSTTGDTQGLSGDTTGLSGDTAVSPNPVLPGITHNPPYPPLTRGAVDKPDSRTAGNPGSPMGSRERQRWRWTERRSTIEERAEQLQLSRWDEAAFGRGGESFQAYTARVYVAHLTALGCNVSLQQLRDAMSRRGPSSEADVLRMLALRAATENDNDSARSSP